MVWQPNILNNCYELSGGYPTPNHPSGAVPLNPAGGPPFPRPPVPPTRLHVPPTSKSWLRQCVKRTFEHILCTRGPPQPLVYVGWRSSDVTEIVDMILLCLCVAESGTVTLSDLQPGRQYTMHLSAGNDVGFGPSVKFIVNTATSQQSGTLDHFIFRWDQSLKL